MSEKKNFMTGKLMGLVFAGLLMLPLLSSVALAAGPEWSAGFPKLSQKNVLLQWSPVKGATEYKVYRGESKGALKVVATVKVNRYIDKDVPAGKTFSYAVSAVSAGKEGERSAVGSVSTAAEKVYVPLKTPKLVGSHVKEQAGGKSSIGIRWEGVGGTDLVGINVYRSKTKGKDYALVGSSQSDTFDDKDVQPGVTYYYVVTAVDNQFNETKYSNEISAEVPAPEKEAAKETKKVEPTTMRPVKLLFRIPREEGGAKTDDQLKPTNAQNVAVDEAVGHIYVASYGYGGVLVYDMQGKLQFGIRKDGVGGEVRINAPDGLAVGDRGNLYVTNFSNNEISVFDFTGKPVDTVTVDVSDIAPGKRARNSCIAVDKEGDLYVSEPATNTVQVLDKRGKRRFYIAGVRTEEETKKDRNKQLFNGPSYITLGRNGEIVFVDAGYSKLMVYNSDGKFLRSFGKPGVNAGELYYPVGLATGDKGEIFVASAQSPNIQAFSTEGKFLYALCNEKGNGPIDANGMRGIAIDSKNRLYVAEGFLGRVSVFQLEERTIEIIPQK